MTIPRTFVATCHQQYSVRANLLHLPSRYFTKEEVPANRQNWYVKLLLEQFLVLHSIFLAGTIHFHYCPRTPWLCKPPSILI
jgi:hypothetical protein